MRAARWLLAAALLVPALAFAFGFEDVDKRAADLAKKSYEPFKNDLPSQLRNLTYDQYRDIRFKNDHALWRPEKLPFEVAFFHRGGQFMEPVRLYEVANGGAPREITYTGERFDYGKNAIDRTKVGNIGFAGFRVHFNVNSPKYKDEVLVFLGASYFRALGKDQRYGLSARGLAVDTGLASGEEFPRFTEFWFERPEPGAKELVIYGLLDSKSMTGAYRFVLKPGTDTVVAVKTRLHARRNIAKLGIAPLTSMFVFGENQPAPGYEDYRPEVHDSDGLSVQLGTGEWVWRPLVNPKRLLVTSFGATNPLGFGLQQRDRNFSSYEDLEARYELRPGAWIKPTKPFGAGRVELVQIPSQYESNDNIVAYWIPRDPPLAGKSIDFEYQVLWQKNNPTRSPTSWVAQTRRGSGFVRRAEPTIDFHVDFEGPAVRKLTEKSKIDAIFTADANGEIVEQALQRNPATEGIRVSLRVKRLDAAKPIEMRGFLRDETENHSETWSYIIPPE